MCTYRGEERRSIVSNFGVDRTWGSPVTAKGPPSPNGSVALPKAPYWTSIIGCGWWPSTAILLARLRLGHTVYTNSYIYLKDPRPTCNLCHHPKTVEHIIVECPTYRRARTRLRGFCNNNNLPFSLQSILGDTNTIMTDLLFSFLREIKLFEKMWSCRNNK